MDTKPRLIFAIVSVLTIVLQACALPSFSAPAATEPPAPEQPPAQPAIVHSVIPSAGSSQVSNAHDNEESTTFEEKSVRAGDEFENNRFERPFTAQDMAYLPYIDIVDAGMTEDDNFYYTQIKLVGVDSATGAVKGFYGQEFDLDIDGRTEVLILAKAPTGSDWTTDGVVVYVDGNGDIGGLSSRSDDAYTGNGYEAAVFDAGNGDDPDLAWVRFVNSSAPIVELAFKKSVLEDVPTFMFSVLSSDNALDPTKMYFNDTFTEERAGSPVKGNAYYPLNELAAFDNTCRLPSGFQPTGSEPYGCQVGKPDAVYEWTPGKKKCILCGLIQWVPGQIFQLQ